MDRRKNGTHQIRKRTDVSPEMKLSQNRIYLLCSLKAAGFLHMQASADVAGFVLRAATMAYCEHVFALKQFNVNI